ncbi:MULTISPECIES: amino acid ABC transporter ATP-binding/permease protein [unclassified Corynebacterium]|uniref:amino acid ABC transporter ATP-binding/permease protein n=1 Tax=unclassified Corynebacterium TaxID=2624378 RepID=UPI0008A2D99B|nr:MULTISPECIES: ABC transporter ATP-binding protein [unclassified Corynebacterium]MDU3111070.1 ABC transporter ATP-binding protein [Corynebacterium sp.]OFO24720.1 beta-(1-->2)glucan export ATP-binding/permease NdvA [Corynebacterium sp. HMSC064E07]
MNNIIWLLRFSAQARGALSASILARVAGHILGALMLAVPAWAIATIALSKWDATDSSQSLSMQWTWAVIGVVAGLALLKAILRYVEQYLGHLAAFRLLGELRLWIVERLIPQAPAVTDGLGTARIHTIAIRDVDRVEVFFAHTIAPAVTAVLIPLMAVVTAASTAGALPAIALTLTFAAGFVIALAGSKKATTEASATNSTRTEVAQYIADTLRLREEILVYGAAEQRLQGLRELDEQLAQKMRAGGKRAGLRSGATGLRIWGGSIAVFCAGIPALSADYRMLPAVLVTTSLVAGTASSMDSIELLASSLPAGLNAVTRIRELAAQPPTVEEPEQQAPLHAQAARANSADPAPALELQSVSYHYPGADNPALTKINLRIDSGQFIGVVGPTGSGKSTLSRLIQRHVDPDVGEVIINGHNARDLGSTNVCRAVVVADQNPFLMEATVAENLCLGAPDGCEVPESLMHWALELAAINPAEMALDRPIGRRAQRLSGGQRQRLALARTYLRAVLADGTKPNDLAAHLAGKIVIFDEATSHQDPLTQARIVDNARACGATCIFIAHRLQTLAEADDILVIENGQLIERGTYDNLLNADGAFARLARAEV